MIESIHQQKQLSLQTHNARVRTSHLRPMRPLRPGRPGVICVSCLASGASRRPFLLPQAPSVPVAAHSIPPPSATLPFRLRRPAYLYQIVRIGCALATFPLPVACIRPLASQNASVLVCPPPAGYWHAYRTMENSLLVTIH